MMTILFSSAAVLGLLAFFEPCTIATHTLYSARIHQKHAALQRIHTELLLLVTVRALFLSMLFSAAVFIVDAPAWGIYFPAAAAALLGLMYLVSRKMYLPVPHLELHRLLPGGTRLPHVFQLALTLPACTLPLLLLVLGVAVNLGSPPLGALAGCVFALLFSLPTVISAYTGIPRSGRFFLQCAAAAAPYVTAVLLLGSAVYLLPEEFNLTVPVLKNSLQEAGWTALGISFAAGFIFSFNPVSFTSIPVMLAYVTKAHKKQRAFVMGTAFVAGMLVTHTTLGIAAALGGAWVQNVMGRHWSLLLGPVLIIMGLMWAGLLKIRLPWFGLRGRHASGVIGAFLLAVPFSVAVCPFCTPALMVALTAAAASASVSYAALLLLAFALGRGIPVIIGAWSMAWLESLHIFKHWQKYFEYFAGVVLVSAGLYMLNTYFLLI